MRRPLTHSEDTAGKSEQPSPNARNRPIDRVAFRLAPRPSQSWRRSPSDVSWMLAMTSDSAPKLRTTSTTTMISTSTEATIAVTRNPVRRPARVVATTTPERIKRPPPMNAPFGPEILASVHKLPLPDQGHCDPSPEHGSEDEDPPKTINAGPAIAFCMSPQIGPRRPSRPNEHPARRQGAEGRSERPIPDRLSLHAVRAHLDAVAPPSRLASRACPMFASSRSWSQSCGCRRTSRSCSSASGGPRTHTP